MIPGLIILSSDAPRDPFFLNFREEVPLKSDFKPAMKVLSRKPIAKIASSSGIGSAQPDDDDGDDENDTTKTLLTTEERQKKAQREREEKQKKYEEARQRLFGEEKVSTNSSATSTSSHTAKQNGESRSQSRNKATRESRPSSSAGNKGRQLYDPNHAANTEKETHTASSRPISEQHPIRNPRGPDNSGRGGFGFAPRGSRGD